MYQVNGLLQPLASLLFANDEETITIICPALSIALPGIPEMVACRRLTELARLVDVYYAHFCQGRNTTDSKSSLEDDHQHHSIRQSSNCGSMGVFDLDIGRCS